jgi:hypothetical protein
MSPLAPKKKDERQRLWIPEEFEGVLSKATPLDQELLLICRYTGINPADIYDFTKSQFFQSIPNPLNRHPGGWTLRKVRNKSQEKEVVYEQPLHHRVVAVLLPRILKATDGQELLYPELRTPNRNHKGGRGRYKDRVGCWSKASLFAGALGDRVRDYWDIWQYELDTRDSMKMNKSLYRIRYGLDYKRKIKSMPKPEKQYGSLVVKGKRKAKDLEFTQAYLENRKTKVVADLRHTRATELFCQDIDREVIRHWIGHSANSKALEKFYLLKYDVEFQRHITPYNVNEYGSDSVKTS